MTKKGPVEIDSYYLYTGGKEPGKKIPPLLVGVKST